MQPAGGHRAPQNPLFLTNSLFQVNFNEPLSMLQRLTEDLEYHELLDRAARCESSLEQLCYVAAFTVSSYSTTVFRTSKPFNPLLGETFELDRLEENGYRSLCEQVRPAPLSQPFLGPSGWLALSCPQSHVQVSHHPPAAAHHADSKNGWTLRQEIKITSKFRGKYLSIMPLGECPRSVWDFQNQPKLQVLFPAQSPSPRYHPLRLPLLRQPLHVEKGDDHGAQHHRWEALDRPGEMSWMGGVWKHGSLGEWGVGGSDCPLHSTVR